MDSTGVLKAKLRQDGLEVIFAHLLRDASQVELLPDDKEMTFTVKTKPQLYTARYRSFEALAWATCQQRGIDEIED